MHLVLNRQGMHFPISDHPAAGRESPLKANWHQVMPSKAAWDMAEEAELMSAHAFCRGCACSQASGGAGREERTIRHHHPDLRWPVHICPDPMHDRL